MHWLVTTAVTNAIAAALLAVVVSLVAACCRRPALVHLLWVLVLIKLLTPPLVEVPLQVPLGWNLHWAELGQGNEKRAEEPHTTAIPTTNEAVRSQPLASPPRKPAISFASAPGEDAVASIVAPSGTGNRIAEAESVVSVPADRTAWRTAWHLDGRQCARSVANSLPIVWGVGVAVSLLILVRRASGFHSFLRRAGRRDAALEQRVQTLALAAGLKCAPAVIAVRGVVSPMLWGLGRRVTLVFPAQLKNELSPDAADTLLLHELAHFARGDQWVRLVELLASVIFWWHPLVWWARQNIEAAEEQCCDGWVVGQRRASRRTYAEALLATIDFLNEQPVLLPPAGSGLGGADLLRERLSQIMRGDAAAGVSSSARLIAIGLALVLLPCAPTLFGGSFRPLPEALAESPESAALRGTESLDSTAPSLQPDIASEAPRVSSSLSWSSPLPPPAITAVATSRNGRYRLERRKGSQVALVHEEGVHEEGVHEEGVHESNGWRLDMSMHGILCVAFTPDSRQFITGHGDGVVRIWDCESGGLVNSLKGASDAVFSVAVTESSPGNCRVAAGTKDGAVLVWDRASGDELARLPPSPDSVSCLRWSSTGELLAISFGDFSNRDENRVVLWSAFDRAVIAESPTERPVAALAWLSGGTGLLIADWQGNATMWQPGFEAATALGSLGPGGKEKAEAAHWSADCPLSLTLPAGQLTIGAE